MEKLIIKKNIFLITVLFSLSFLTVNIVHGASLINAVIPPVQQQAANCSGTSCGSTNTNTGGSLINAVIPPVQQQAANCSGTSCGSTNTNTTINTNTSNVTYTAPSCPFYPSNTRTVVYFNASLRSDQGDSRGFKDVSTSLPAGTYNISSFSWDGYEGRTSMSQPNERYFLQLRNNGNIVVSTNSTADLTDRVTTAYWQGVVNSNLSVSQNINSIRVMHSVYPDTSSPNSVNAICAAFDLITPPTPPVDSLNASCTVSPSSINIGGSLSWGVSASGGNGTASYIYSWAGTDGLTGNLPFVSRVYNTAGTKTGTVTVTSGSQSVTRNCTAVVNQNPIVNNLSVSCSASPSSVEIDEEVEWQAYVSGGNGSYNYSWSGSEGLSGSQRNIDWEYDNDGTKTGTVTVTSDGQSATASCTVRVDEEEENNDDLEVSCYANPTNPQIGSRMNWYARVEGGDGDYDYEWTGTDDLDSSSRSPSMTYYTAGTKRATVEVRDGDGQRATRTCNAYVNQNTVLAFSQTNQPPLAQAVYLNQVPYTGIADNYKTAIFMSVLALLSAWIAYIVISYKKNNPEQI